MVPSAMPWFTITFWIMLLVVCGYAAARGGRSERRAATMLLAAAVATVLVRSPWAVRYAGVESGVVIIDLTLLIGLLALAQRADRTWPLFLAALQAVTLLGHLGKYLNPELWRLGYAIMVTAPAYPGLLLLALGTYRHGRRKSSRRSAGSWSPFSRPWIQRAQDEPPTG